MNAISRLAHDPLLMIAKGILYFLMGVMCVAALGCLAGMVGFFAFPEEIAKELGKDAPGIDFAQFRWAIEIVLLLAVGILGMLFRVFLLLKRVVDTVGQGDPFVPVNASRLTQMAWIVLAMQVIGIPLAALGMWIQKMTEDAVADAEIHVSGGNGNGLLLVLILFVLARVFRKGAEMRAELEGTV
jgi:hypothetical protein